MRDGVAIESGSEGSVRTLVFHQLDAKYFSLTPDDTERLERQLDEEEQAGAAP